MVDDGETDWKVGVIRASDPAAASATEMTDSQKTIMKRWMSNYKSYDCRVAGLANYSASFHASLAGSVPDCADLYISDHQATFPPACPYEDAGITFFDFGGTTFGDAEGFLNVQMTKEVIAHNHHTWKKLVEGEYKQGHKYAIDIDSSTKTAADVSTESTLDWFVKFGCGNNPKSYWHDIPWKVGDTYSFVCEISKDTCQKMETMTKRPGNPIQQDDKKGVPRYIKMGAYPFNYGMIPQTWESEFEPDILTGLKGDRDPIDVVDFTSTPCVIGETYTVKVLGSLAMVDDGETDWKVGVIRATDPAAASATEMTDSQKTIMKRWMSNYKSYDCRVAGLANYSPSFHASLAGSVPDCADLYTSDHQATFPPDCPYQDAGITFFDFGGTTYGDAEGFLNVQMTEEVIAHNHHTWKKLVNGDYGNDHGYDVSVYADKKAAGGGDGDGGRRRRRRRRRTVSLRQPMELS